jgi:flagellar protein FliO/FliZ
MRRILNAGVVLMLPSLANAAEVLPAVGPVILQLLLVLAAIGVCAWLVRRTPLVRRTGKILKVKDSLSLGARERLLVVHFENRELLLGVNSQRITLLSECDASRETTEDTDTPAESRSFFEMLSQRS